MPMTFCTKIEFNVLHVISGKKYHRRFLYRLFYSCYEIPLIQWITVTVATVTVTVDYSYSYSALIQHSKRQNYLVHYDIPDI